MSEAVLIIRKCAQDTQHTQLCDVEHKMAEIYQVLRDASKIAIKMLLLSQII